MRKFLVIAANFVVPGLGSLLAGERARGALQILIMALAVLLWLTVSLRLGAIPLAAFAWIWGMFTALDYKQHADVAETSPVEMVVKQKKQHLSMRRPERS